MSIKKELHSFMSKLAHGLAERDDRLASGGRDEELQTMLSDDMTLAEAVHTHIHDIWEYSHVEGFDHESGHVLLGLAFNAPPHRPLQDKPYQGSYDSEIYNFQIEKILLGTITGRTHGLYDDRQDFITGVLANFRMTAAQENLNRTLGWVMSKESGMSYDDLRLADKHDDDAFQARAESMGLEIQQNPNSRAWSVGKPGMGDDFFFIGPNDCLLPDSLEGGQNFEPFERPSVQEIVEVYERLLPAVQLLQSRVLKLDRKAINDSGQSFGEAANQAMGDVKVRDLYRAIVNRRPMPTPEPEPDTAPV